MKILHVCETALGGVGTHLNELIPLQLASGGQDQIILLAPRGHLALLTDIPPLALRTFWRPSRLLSLPFLAVRFIGAVVRFRPDIVHVHSTVAGIIVRLIAPFFQLKVIYCPHSWAMDREQSALMVRVISFVERALAKVTARIVAVSENERQRGLQIGIPAHKIITVLNGIKSQPPEYPPVEWTDPRLKLLFVGRLDRQKGIDVLLKAIDGLEDKVVVRVIGDRVVGDKHESFAAYPHVEHLGWLNSAAVNAQLAACDLVVMPSRWEGLPIVGLEAMRARKPLVAASVGGIPELVEEGKTGLLFPSDDHEALRRLLLHVERPVLRAMGEAAYQRFVDGFTAPNMAASIIAIYHSISANAGQTSLHSARLTL